MRGSSEPIKIGVAKDVRARIRGLQTGNPELLRLLYVLPGDNELEWQLHRKLKGSRIQGEWFAGPKVEPFLYFLADLAEQMVEAYAGNGKAPHYRDFGTWAHRSSKEMVVRYVEPNPLPPEEAMANLKARWMRHRQPGEVYGDATVPSTGTIN